MNTTLDHLRAAYPRLFDGAVSIRTLDNTPGITDSVTEILYGDEKIRSIRWTNRTDLHNTLRKLEEEES